MHRDSNSAASAFTGPFTVDQRAVLDALPDGVLLTDASGNVYDVNSAFCSMMASPRAELIGAHVSSFVDPDDLRQRPPRLEEFLRNRSIRSQRLFRRKDGSLFWVDFHARKVSEQYTLTVFREMMAPPADALPSVA